MVRLPGKRTVGWEQACRSFSEHSWDQAPVGLSSEAPVGRGGGDEGMALEPGPHWIGEEGVTSPLAAACSLAPAPPGAASGEKRLSL